jgi:hypothetical protein
LPEAVQEVGECLRGNVAEPLPFAIGRELGEDFLALALMAPALGNTAADEVLEVIVDAVLPEAATGNDQAEVRGGETRILEGLADA